MSRAAVDAVGTVGLVVVVGHTDCAVVDTEQRTGWVAVGTVGIVQDLDRAARMDWPAAVHPLRLALQH